ncbi:MAG: GatB/YqeY domain-containing protein [Oscillospiraceae bacterium]
MEFTELQGALKDAMKAKDTIRKEAVQTLIAAVKKAAIDSGTRDNISSELVDSVILKELKVAKEQVDTCPESCAEQLEEYKCKYEIIKSFAPAQMSEEELYPLIKEKFGELIASGNKGAYMKAVMAELKGKADGKLINKVISDIASGK